MKKIVFALGLLLALNISVFAQVPDDEVVIFNAHLNETLNLNVDGVTQEITFATAADYNLGVTEAGGIVPGFTIASVEATKDWYLEIQAPDFTPGGGPNPGTGAIPIDNLGVYVTESGTYNFGAELVCTNTTAASAMGITVANQTIINNGTGNAGDASDNAFTFHWLMGTMQGTMETESMFNQLALGTIFSTGDFTTTATLTLTAVP